MKKGISILIPTINEAGNIGILLDKISDILKKLRTDYEIIVIDGGSTDNTASEAATHGAIVLRQKEKGFGAAIRQGVSASTGKFIITMDADLSHGPQYIKDMWAKRNEADMIIASRYVKGGKADMPWWRWVLSIILNRVFSAVLSLPFKDISSGFRMYRADILKTIGLKASDFDIEQEIIIKFYIEAYDILEIPIYFIPRKRGRSHIQLLKFGFSFAKTLFSMWQLRNSIFSADYDSRAYNSKIPIQRYWHRRRFSIIKNFIGRINNNILDIGCGSSQLIKSLPNAVGLDIRLKVLRHLRKTTTKLVQATLQNLCFKKNSFDLIIISEVIEHLPKEYFRLDKIREILRENGIIIIGTPDYASPMWRIIEYFYKKLLPHAYGEGHISNYTFDELKSKLKDNGFSIMDYRYICAGDVYIKARKINPIESRRLYV